MPVRQALHPTSPNSEAAVGRKTRRSICRFTSL
jgi:hypothetical protein